MITSLLPELPDVPDDADRDGARLRVASLAPQFDEGRHGLYRDLLERAIRHPDTRNLALTGAYGAGKSSVLSELAKAYGDRVVEISLSTLLPDSDESPGADENPVARTPTNRIQKEIVKQLLYRLPTSKTPRSRFRRASTTPFWRELSIASAWGGALYAGAVVLGAVPLLVGVLPVDSWRVPASYALIAAATIAATWTIRHAINGRVMVNSVSAGSATVTLAPTSTSYFDQYLDEIVYFFQVSKCNVVVIEDIDRFEDSYVFDTLRALNGLLNRSQQIGRRIVFVYAIRDSVFETIGSDLDPDSGGTVGTDNSDAGSTKVDRARAALERANRTKFFDVIIPVVPFITHDNARDLMTKAVAGDDFTISPALIRLAARHVADMRLIHNIRNEFEVYRNRLITSTTPVFGLTDDRLFAIVLFKNTHLADFEAIRLQSSTLDRLFELWRRLVRENMAAETKQLTRLRADKARGAGARARAADLGERLLAYTEVLAYGYRTRYSRSVQVQVLRDGEPADDDLRTSEFWAGVAAGSTVTVKVLDRGYRELDFAFDAEDLETLLHVTIDEAAWARSDEAALSSQIAGARDRLEFLRHHTWQQLYARPEFTVSTSESADPSEPTISFRAHAATLLESQLARELVEHGYLTHHFALYVSTFYGEHISPDAMEYLMRYVEPGETEPTYPLSARAAAQVLTARGTDLLHEPSVYNLGLMDYLLTQRPRDAKVVTRRLTAGGDEERAFVDLYISHSEHAPLLIAAMAPHWLQVFTYVASDAPVDDDRKIQLLDAALSASAVGTQYQVDAAIRSLIESRYREVSSITRPRDDAQAEAAFAVLRRSGTVLASVDVLDRTALHAAMATGTYAVTEPNLTIMSPSGSIELDALKAKRPPVYTRAISQLDAYVEAMGQSPATSFSISGPEVFPSIVADAASGGRSSALDTLIRRANPSCRVPELPTVPSAAWPALVHNERTTCDLRNVHAYLEAFGRVDEHLAALLSGSGRVDWLESDELADRRTVALKIIEAGETIPDPKVRAELAASLQPGALPADDVAPEAGPLPALLLQHGLLEDDESTFSGRLMVDWPTLEAAIVASGHFHELASPATVPVRWIVQLVASRLVSMETRRAVVTRLRDYLTDADRSTTRAIADALNTHGWRLRFVQLEALLEAGAPPSSLIAHIARSDDFVTDEQFRDLLRRMGGSYAQIADPGTKRPTVPGDDAHRTVLRRLERLGVVSSVTPVKGQGGIVRVQLRREGGR